MPIIDKRTSEINPQKFIKETKGVSVNKKGEIAYNPGFGKNFDEKTIKAFWDEYDARQCTSRYRWENIPFKGLTSIDIERMRYYRGELGCLALIGAILPTIHGGKVDYYGHAKEGALTTFSGPYDAKSKKIETILNSKFFEYVYDGYKDIYTKEELFDKVIVLQTPIMSYNNVPYASRYALNQVIITQMVDLFRRISNNVTVASKKLIFKVKDGNSVNKVYEDLSNAFSADSPIVVVGYDVDSDSIQNQSDLKIQDYFAGIKQYDNIRCLASGISTQSYGNDKKERNISAEVDDVGDKVDNVNDVEFQLMQEFADAVNKAMGTTDFRPVKVQEESSVSDEPSVTFEEGGQEND